jgi:hypothetical protein
MGDFFCQKEGRGPKASMGERAKVDAEPGGESAALIFAGERMTGVGARERQAGREGLIGDAPVAPWHESGAGRI